MLRNKISETGGGIILKLKGVVKILSYNLASWEDNTMFCLEYKEAPSKLNIFIMVKNNVTMLLSGKGDNDVSI